MDKKQKQESISYLNSKITENNVILVAHYDGLTVSKTSQLRAQLREKNIVLKVVKNKLAKIALQNTDKEILGNILQGPTVLAFAENPVDASKIFTEFSKSNEPFKILGGTLGKEFIHAQDIENLSKMPSLEVLRGKIVGVIHAIPTKIANLTIAPANKIARVIHAKY